MEEQNINSVDLPTQQYLKECFDYNEESGELIRRERPLHHFKNSRIMNFNNTQFGNKVAGRIDKAGYCRVKIDGRTCAAHRIIWKWYYGVDPVDFIDHINGDKSDNRISNLRDIERGSNAINLSKLKECNSTGYTGVAKARNGRYRSYTNVDGKQKCIGTYGTPEEAALARELKCLEIYGEEFYHANEKNKILLEELKLKVKVINNEK
jgi:hypothetical protein